MEKIPKLPKANLIFIDDPVVKEFIEYCKTKYSDKIEKINIYLNTEHDDWQMSVQEEVPGLAWLPWHIPTSTKPIIVGNMDLFKKKIVKSKYSIVEINKDKKQKK